MPTTFVFPGPLPHLASAVQMRWPPQQAVQRRDGRTVSFFSLSQRSKTTTTRFGMATRHGHGVAGESRGRRRAGGGRGGGVTRNRVRPSPSTSSPRSLGSGMGVLWGGVLWGVGGEVGSGRGGLGDDDSEINERDGDGDDVDAATSEQDSLAQKKNMVDGSTDASRADIVAAGGGGKGPSTPPPPSAFDEAEPEKRPAGGAGEEPSRRGRSDSTVWMPQLFPPSSEEGDENESFIKPLIELPLDGILLQLFPALLIGVLGVFLTIAVQVEASRFDGMVGEDGGAVVVTDLRETRKMEP